MDPETEARFAAREKREATGCVIALVLAVAIPVVCVKLTAAYTEIAAIELEDGRKVAVLAKAWCDVTQAFDYEVRDEGRTVVARWQIAVTACGDPYPEFTFLKAEDGHLVAITAKEASHVVFAVHDFQTGETWPRPQLDEDHTETHERGLKLLKRLKAAMGDAKLVLASDVPDGPFAGGGQEYEPPEDVPPAKRQGE